MKKFNKGYMVSAFAFIASLSVFSVYPYKFRVGTVKGSPLDLEVRTYDSQSKFQGDVGIAVQECLFKCSGNECVCPAKDQFNNENLLAGNPTDAKRNTNAVYQELKASFGLAEQKLHQQNWYHPLPRGTSADHDSSHKTRYFVISKLGEWWNIIAQGEITTENANIAVKVTGSPGKYGATITLVPDSTTFKKVIGGG